jgi:hypothetical protein
MGGCSGISQLNRVIRCIASCHEREGRGFFVGGSPSMAHDTIDNVVAFAKGADMVSRDMVHMGEILMLAVNARARAVALKGVMLSC